MVVHLLSFFSWGTLSDEFSCPFGVGIVGYFCHISSMHYSIADKSLLDWRKMCFALQSNFIFFFRVLSELDYPLVP